MRFGGLILFILLNVCKLNAQHPGLNYAISVGGSANPILTSLERDSLGNIYSSGFFSGVVDFDPSAAVYTMTANSSFQDFYIVKYNSSGQFQWAVHADVSSGSVRSNGMSIDKSGNVYITGQFSGTVDFDPSPTVLNLTSAGGWDDIFVLKYNTNGIFQWAFSIGSTGQDIGKKIANDQYGNIYISGIFFSTVDFDPSVATSTLITTVTSAYVAKYNTNGLYQWAFNLPSVNSQTVNSLACDLENNIYVVGACSGVADFDPSASVANLTSNGSGDIFLAKYNYNGQYKWAFNIGASSEDVAYDVDVDSAKNVYLCGNYVYTIDYDPSAATVLSSNATSFTGYPFLAKYDSLGNYSWAFSLGNGSSNGYGKFLDIDKNNNIYFAGEISGTIDFDPSLSATMLTCVNDIFASKYNSNGQFIWAFKTGATSGPTCANIVATDSDQVYLGGNHFLTFDIDPYPPIYNMQYSYIAKYACSNPTTPVNITSPANQIGCSGASSTLSASSNGNVNWYSSPTSNFLLYSGFNFITPPLNVGTYTFYTESQMCSINPIRTPITVTVIASPTVSVAGSSTMCAGTSQTLIASGASTYSWNTSATTSSISVSPTAFTTYSVTGTAPNGCKSATVISISMVSPGLTMVFTPTYVCSGSSVTITAGGANTYTWNTASTNTSIVVTPTANTTYTVIGSDANGCLGSVTGNIWVANIPTITVSGSTIVCAGTPVTLTAGGANVYAWSAGPNSVSITVTPTITTTYTVTGTTAASGCSNTAMATVTVSVCTGVDEFEIPDLGLLIYPNPNNGIFVLEINSVSEIVVTNVLGEEILKQETVKGKNKIDIQNQASGIYFVKIINSESKESITEKIIKQ